MRASGVRCVKLRYPAGLKGRIIWDLIPNLKPRASTFCRLPAPDAHSVRLVLRG